jgi:hypothetical protein
VMREVSSCTHGDTRALFLLLFFLRRHGFGEFRTAANRGGGFCHPFVAKKCKPSPHSAASDDLESQRRVYLSDTELRARLLDGSFQEIKWTATVALALLV